MAGVVAMASVIEDFDTQSCKKSHKVSDPPSVKTITNYFSPLPKPMETHFSPPRSNNITSYFHRKAQPPREKGSTPEQTKENHLGPQPTKASASVNSPVTRPAKPPQKRVRKPSKAARQVHLLAADAGSTETEDCIVLDGPGDAEGSEDNDVSSSSCFLGSDTAALLAQVSADVGVAGDTVDKNDIVCPEKAPKDSKKEASAKKRESCERDSPRICRKDRRKCNKPVPDKKGLALAKRCQEEGRDTEECVAEGQEAELSLCDESLKMNVSEESQLNGSTVTISFTDFLQSQEEQVENGSGVDPDTEEKDTLEAPEVNELPVSHVSPRTLTIQAEVHPISPGHEPVRVPEKRLASIFSRGKEGVPAAVEVKPDCSPCLLSTLELLPAPKRRSNVVLLEKDLELSVVEVESTHKCSQMERKQFMSAFKQPVKPGKGLAKPSVEARGDTAVEEKPSSVSPTQEQPVKKTAKKKPPRRGRGKAEEEAVPSPVTQEGPVPMETVDAEETDARPEVEPTTSTPTHIRRSIREALCRPMVEPSPKLRTTKTKKVNSLSAVSEDGQIQMSSPKVHRSKHRVFRAQMVSPPDDTCSPIRMRFTRVFPSAASESANGIGVASKESSASKRQKEAKKLVKKAKQHTKKTAVHQEDQSSLRRSSRSQVSKMSYNEDEGSVICLEEESQDGSAQTTNQKGKSLKRSLNDVLGKKTPASKETKNAAASVFLVKKAQRTSVISIFDDSSRDGSDNSQDDEKFRARREFLKSGLPESFKKQVAKTAATQEAYAASCSSFQPVVHVLQTPQGCPLWSLPWPDSPHLQCLQELPSLPSILPQSLPRVMCFRTEPSSRAHRERGSGLRQDFSEPVRKLLLEEISASNPHFPVQRFLTRFLNRRAEHLQQYTASESGSQAPSDLASAQSVGGKRKRVDESEAVPEKAAKKPKSSRLDEDKAVETPKPELPRRGGRGRRCKKLQDKDDAPVPSKTDPVIILEDSPLADSSVKDADLVKEDVLWTEKYQPQHSSDIIGNTASVRRLHSWLKEWKLRADRDERKRQKEKKQEDNSNDSWDTEDGDSQEGEEFMCNTLLITGPTGVGKTAAVYACAQELGFKVFEVNASSQRNGRQILSQLKEATQSHQVDIQGVTASKPCYFNSYSSTRAGTSPRKGNSPRRAVSSPRKPAVSPRSAKRGTLAPTSLANFFKMGRPSLTSKQPAQANHVKNQSTAAPSRTCKGERSPKTVEPPKAAPANKGSCPPANEQSKKTATSLILFEEVDVIFDDDSGFLAAIKTFMTTTKRPVILTTSDPTFSTMFDGYFEQIHFKTPSMVNVASYLQLLCLAENTRVDAQDMSSLLQVNGCDIRQSLMGLQFWSRSAGGQQVPLPLSHSSPTDVQPTTLDPVEGSECEGLTPGKALPPGHTGCTESLLGLWNIELRTGVLDLLKSAVEPGCWELLTACRTRGVHLLYSNMEALLPLPTTSLTAHRHPSPDQPSADPQEVVAGTASVKPDTDSVLTQRRRRGDLLSHANIQQAAEGLEPNGSPVKLSSRMKRKKKQTGRKDQDPFLSDSDSDNSFLSLRRPPQSAPRVQDEGTGMARVGRMACLTPEQRLKSRPISSCLGSLAEFLDHMSLLDSCLRLHASPPGGAGHPERIFGLRAPVGLKDGMTDEPREEGNAGSWVVEERVGQIQTAVEALSFQRCRAGVEVAWGEAQGLEEELRKEAVVELTLPVASHRHGFRLTQETLCEPTVLQRRTEVMDLLPTRVAGALGNRAAAALDFLPSIRSICRSEALKEQGKVKRRFLHYLNSIHLDFSKDTLQHLAEDFP